MMLQRPGTLFLSRHRSPDLSFGNFPNRCSTAVCLLGFLPFGQKKAPPMGRRLRRNFEEVSSQTDKRPCLTVLQWNVLADGLAQYGDFVRVPRELLSWEARAPMLLEEILDSAADIICLQEVNRYEDFFRPRLQKAGYTGVFWPKACSPAEQYGFPCDGCTLFFRTERFELLGAPCGQPFSLRGGPPGKQGMLHALLKDRLSGQSILAATTHLKAKRGQANEAARELQAVQMMERLAAAEAASSAAQRNGNGASAHRPVVILCGDFNDVPTSAACRVVREHSLGLACTWDPPGFSGSISGNGAAPAGACKPGEEAPFTTWKFRPEGVSQGIIDFIWFSRARLRLLRRWRMPKEADIGEAGLPCERYSSDHLALCAVFDLLPDDME